VCAVVKGTRQAGRRAGWGPSEAAECARAGLRNIIRQKRNLPAKLGGCARKGRRYIVRQKSNASSEAAGMLTAKVKTQQDRKAGVLAKLEGYICAKRRQRRTYGVSAAKKCGRGSGEPQ